MKKKYLLQKRHILLLLYDIFCFFAVDLFYYFLTVSFTGMNFMSRRVYLIGSLILFAMIFILRIVFRIYGNVWRYTSTIAYFKLVVSDCIAGVLACLISRSLQKYEGIWLFLSVASLTALVALMSRFSYRLIYKHRHINSANDEVTNKISVAIVGAGQIGVMLANELRCNVNSVYTPLFFIDIDPAKIGSTVSGLEVYPENEKIVDFIASKHVSEIIITISALTNEQANSLYTLYAKTSCKIKVYDVPVIESGNKASQGRLREFQIEDLLFRKSLSINDEKTLSYYKDKTVLITGGGGSIGSELCRQIASCKPKKLIIVDIYENNAYDIQQELLRKYGDKLELYVEIASVRDVARLDCIFDYYRPDVVFHAAAHKHVPLMEHSNCEAIKNNVLGTYNTANAAEKYGVKKFILISTDKAVNPTNVMGASKRMCEMIVQCRTDSKTIFGAVRFGNVLGSNGSVVPLFKRQIASGGPVTITDKRIIRYFMTIVEASQLVIKAGAMANKNELFVLDMGKPVKIYDLAVNMIKLSGYEVGKDIEIKEIGLRPGEKLYEELLMKSETLDKTENDMIFIEKDEPLTREQVEQKLVVLRKAVEDSVREIGSSQIKTAMKSVIPTYVDPDKINAKAEQSDEMKKTLTVV